MSVALLISLLAPALILYDSKLLNLAGRDAGELEATATRLAQVRGVLEVSLVLDEGVAYLKVDPDNYDADSVEALTVS